MATVARSSMLLLAAVMLGAFACSADAQNFTLPPLPYNISDLQPIVNNQTVFFHHDVLQLNYINKLNAALYNYSSGFNSALLTNQTLTALLRQVGANSTLPVPSYTQTALRHNIGGAWNHAFFWRVQAPYGSPETALPSNTSNLTQAVVQSFGSWGNLFNKVDTNGANLFGSGWTWVVVTQDGTLSTTNTPNQDNPLSGPNYAIPILGNDLWEHSYYLAYGPAKSAYLSNWWSIVNWQQVEANYNTALSGLNGDPVVLAALISSEADTPADSNSNSNTNTNINTNTNSGTNSDTNTNSNSDTDSNSNSDTDSNTNSNTNTNTDTDTNTNTNSDTNSNSNTNTNTNTNTNSDNNSNSNTNTNTNTDTDSDTDTSSNTDTNSNTNSNSNSDTNSNSNSDTNTNSDTNSNTNADTNTNTDTDSDTDTSSNINSNTNTNTNN